MPIKPRQELYDKFLTGNKPTQDDFVDLIDSAINIAEDGIGISGIGKPMELIEQGTARRYLDFSSSKENPVWRFGAQSNAGGRNGLNISYNNNSKFFIRQETGSTGINTDDPAAMLHIVADGGTALRVDDMANNPLILVDTNGSIGIGAANRELQQVTINGNIQLNGASSIDGTLKIQNGLTVNGHITTQQGLVVHEGITVQNGLVTAQAGLTVTGNVLTASSGAIVNGEALEVQAGLTVTGDVLTANAGAILSSLTAGVKGLTVKNGAVIETGLLEVKNGLSVTGQTALASQTTIDGLLTANGGLSVANDSAFNADGLVTLGNANTGNVTINGALQANQGIVVANAELEAKNGAVISGSQLEAANGLTVRHGATFETGELIAKGGISITDGSALKAEGPVTLGSSANDPVTVKGGLQAANGLSVNGSELVAQSGATIMETLNVPGISNLTNATIGRLTVTNIDIKGDFNLATVNFSDFNAVNAGINNLKVTDKLAVEGKCVMDDDAVLAAGQIIITYEGSLSPPGVTVVKGTVISAPGHFDITIADNKLITITYNDSSNIDNFFDDWEVYQNEHPDKAAGFQIDRFGSSAWEITDREIGFTSSGIPYQEYILEDCGLRIMYTGSLAGTPQFEIKANEDTSMNQFQFKVNGLALVIKYPGNEELRTIDQLMLDWEEWTGNQPERAGDFELQAVADQSGVVVDTNQMLLENSTHKIFHKGVIKTNTVTVGGALKFGGSHLAISNISDSNTLFENSDSILPTQKAVKAYVDQGLSVVNAALGTLNQTLSTKANQTAVDSLNSALTTANQTLSTKADQTAVDSLDSALATVNQTLSTKADQTAMDSLNSALATANQTLSTKADQTAVDSLNSALATANQTLTTKADQTAMDSLDSTLSTISQTVSTKADQSALNDLHAALTTKSGLFRPNEFSVPAEGTATVQGMGLTTDSRGLMMVFLKDSSNGSNLGTSIFAVHGMETVAKIAGAGMGDEPDGNIYNLYYDTGDLAIQNTTTDAVTATVTYIGS
jgi:hypothetical protein